MKRLNPKTNKPFKKGERREDGFSFYCYSSDKKYKNGYFHENWFSPKAYQRKIIGSVISNAKSRTKKNFNIDNEYLTSIYPKNNLCPILGIEMEFGGGIASRKDSPSLDRINPEKGYVKGNVHWICYRANEIKSNLTIDELILLGQWAKKNKT